MSQAPTNPPPPPVDLKDVQGDIILGIPKRVEHFFFFTIKNVAPFKRVVGSKGFSELITSTADIQKFREKIQAQKASGTASLISFSAVNIAFTQTGLTLLGLTEDIRDPEFKAGQLSRARDLGDGKVTADDKFDPAWDERFKGKIDGLILIAGDSDESVEAKEKRVLSLFQTNIHEVWNVHAQARPYSNKGHEHFGYMDGISSPAVEGINSAIRNPGQQVIDPGVLLMGQPGDPNQNRPPWAKNGSILVYRHLEQLVPEFNKFKRDTGELLKEDPELLGARLFGRWKSGAPVEKAPNKDDTTIATNPKMNNDFDFTKFIDQTNCPFAAHIRKTNPRTDIDTGSVASHSINRTGLPFGPEVIKSEHDNIKTENPRGLAFVCYQSSLKAGFEFMQTQWVNNVNFPFKTVNGNTVLPGFDPIIGQNNGKPRSIVGLNSKAQETSTSLPMEFVVSKGGAYFFSPSISTLKTKIGTPS